MQVTSYSLPNFKILRIQLFRIFWQLPCPVPAGLPDQAHGAREALGKPISPVRGIVSAIIIC